MNDPHTWPPPGLKHGAMDLEGWMAIASWSLPEDAAARVCEEAFEDYSRAYGSAIRDGMPEAAARAWALTVLGDPYVANHSHRKTRGADREAIAADQWNAATFRMMIALLTFFCGFFVFGAVSKWSEPKADHGLLASVVVVAAIVYVFGVWVAYLQTKRARLYRIQQKASIRSSLDEWLYEATQNLGAGAKRRVRAEVTTHYEALCAESLCNGASTEEATEFAMRQLGDAKTASQHFRAIYFTTIEINTLRNIYFRGWGRAARVTVGSIAFLLVAAFSFRLLAVLLTPSEAEWGDLTCAGGIVAAVMLSSPVVIGRRYPRVTLVLQMMSLNFLWIFTAIESVFDPKFASNMFGSENFGAFASILKYLVVATFVFNAVAMPVLMGKTYLGYIRKLNDSDNRRELGL